MEIWKDKSLNFLDYDELGSSLDDKCLDNEICPNNFEEIIKRKPNKDVEDLGFKPVCTQTFAN